MQNIPYRLFDCSLLRSRDALDCDPALPQKAPWLNPLTYRPPNCSPDEWLTPSAQPSLCFDVQSDPVDGFAVPTKRVKQCRPQPPKAVSTAEARSQYQQMSAEAFRRYKEELRRFN